MKEELFNAMDLDNRIKLLAIDEKKFAHLKGSPDTHHQYFHLNDIDKASSNFDDEAAKNLKLRNHISRVQQDLQNSWQSVPFDMPGEFFQAIPRPPRSNHEGEDGGQG